MTHAKKNLNHDGGRIQKRFLAIFPLPGSLQVCLPLRDARRGAELEAGCKSRADEFGSGRRRVVLQSLSKIEIEIAMTERNFQER